jgi:hypothetical protein
MTFFSFPVEELKELLLIKPEKKREKEKAGSESETGKRKSKMFWQIKIQLRCAFLCIRFDIRLMNIHIIPRVGYFWARRVS